MTDRLPVVTVLTAPDEDPPPGLDQLDGRAEVRMSADTPQLASQLPGTDVLLVTDFRTDAVVEAWPAADRLGWVHATSAGVDALLFPALRESDIALTNARGIFDRPIAEYVLGLILAFAKDTRGNIELQQAAEWRHRDTERIDHKQVLVIGAGAIGGEIARLCTAAGMQVDGIARTARDVPGFASVHAIDALSDHLPRADYVVVAAPLNKATHHLFDADAFRAMKPGARFINIGRGPIVDTDALVQALESGEIAGAGLDVFEEEPLPADHPLWGLPNVILSAHMAGDFRGWRAALIDQFMTNFDRWQAGEPLHNLVDKKRGAVPPRRTARAPT
ncbi:D-2-hydroxyacid dehydrogenase [Salinisphaera sp. P385]|uniref:D-2-hydroxyacid dehydrogenase n=1 Tax=Spectribacter acetivorans TaxID=3075603 RepID=A0ABU3B610_9GAMM|nr:D-2-hydroxyacid dehydrogenase [Salinisphaera sp. P385]MDT0617684.1 D-2-hydroxyacid dehydrogenase [Salinisphaera sp. P385]